MKKIISILIVSAIAISMSVSGQITSKLRTTVGGSVDSVTAIGTTAIYLYLNPTQSYKCMSFQSNIIRKSSAMGGNMTLQGSNDNVTYVTTAASDTIHVTNGATDAAFLTVPASTGLPYRYYRMKIAGLASDTMYVHVLFNGRQ